MPPPLTISIERRTRARRARAVVLALFALACAAPLRAQVDTTRGTPETPPPVVADRVDSSSLAVEEYTMTKSPTTAVLLSVLPGAGQVYNEQYIKAALFAGAAGFFAAQAIRYHLSFARKADEVEALPLDDSTGTRDFRKREREFFRDNRDLNAAYYLGVWLLASIDAYVGAHLFDFDVDGGEDGLSSRFYLDPTRMGVGVMMRW